MSRGVGPPAPRYCLRPPRPERARDLCATGLAPALAELLAARLEEPVDVEALRDAPLAGLPNPDAIPDMDVAVERLVQALDRHDRIVLAVDHDMDGQASAAVLWTALTVHFGVPAERLAVVSSHRLREGYGITPAVVERICAWQPQLVISADKGSSDEPRIAQLKSAGIDVIVTDHHAVPEAGPPASALACVNPTREDSRFDGTVCGAAVAFFCMARLRTRLVALEPTRRIPSLAPLLDYVAVATIADCVSLRPDRAPVNRTLVRHGLARINARTRPCWEVFVASRDGAPVDSQTVGFQLAPAIAAAGRMDWADLGFDFLTADSVAAARRCWEQLSAENQERKRVEARIRAAAQAQVDAMDPLPDGIAVFLEDGHSGVHGITASRLVERYGRPAAVFAPRGQGARSVAMGSTEPAAEDDMLAGSFRSIPGLPMRDTLQDVANEAPHLLQAFGGHAGAAGASVRREDFPAFAAAFARACARRLAGRDLRPRVDVDALLDAAQLDLALVDELAALDPWGRDFPPPCFAREFAVEDVRPMGDGTHAKVALTAAGRPFEAVWFAARSSASAALPLAAGELVMLVFRLEANVWNGRRRLQLQIIGRADDIEGPGP